ncbi:MAG: putative sulfate exporter family transporter [Planctomycetes bacterium]|nr:putative sulfate exporter family transporter [Planctomycetota bacterium]MCB9909890.1 putative sulfate exporter family transporter [Planctomycetota bacterium]
MPPRLVTPLVWVLCFAIAALSDWARPQLGDSPWIPGASVLALVLGAVLVHLPGVRPRVLAASKAIVKHGIPYAIVLIGFGLSLTDLWKADVLGWGLVAVVVAMLVAFGSAGLFGRLFGLDVRTSMLIGAGTAVCGNSAIMAVAPVVQPEEEDLALSLAVINLLGLLMVFVLPPLGNWTGIDGGFGGMLAGMTVHAVPQAVAAGEAFGEHALRLATLYKLLRVALLMPTVLLLALIWSRRGKAEGAGSSKAKVPGFLWLFVVAGILRSVGAVDWAMTTPWSEGAPIWKSLQQVGKFVLTAVMAAVGMGIYLPSLVRVGPRILFVGILTAAAMTACAVAEILVLRSWISDGMG